MLLWAAAEDTLQALKREVVWCLMPRLKPWLTWKQEQKQKPKQIPFGNDNQKSKNKSKSAEPMVSRGSGW